jgi:hypothetical protein
MSEKLLALIGNASAQTAGAKLDRAGRGIFDKETRRRKPGSERAFCDRVEKFRMGRSPKMWERLDGHIQEIPDLHAGDRQSGRFSASGCGKVMITGTVIISKLPQRREVSGFEKDDPVLGAGR